MLMNVNFTDFHVSLSKHNDGCEEPFDAIHCAIAPYGANYLCIDLRNEDQQKKDYPA